PPTTDLDEPARLQTRLAAIGEPAGRWLAVLDRLDAQVAAAAAARWPQRRDAYAAVERTLSETGVAARLPVRDGGTLNADRAVLFEEAEGDLAELVLDGGQP